jgi:hypothetical protein
MTKISNQYSLTNVLTADVVNGRVGVNNGSPTVALDVTGAGKFSNVVTATRGSFAPSFIAIGSSAGNGQIQISNSANYVIGAGTDYGGMSFTVGGGERLNILNNGSVGIGTSSPPHNLSVKGSSATDMISWTDNVNNTGYLGIRGGGVVWMNADNNLVFATAATERMRITSGGDLYFGSSSITTATTSIYLEKAGGDIIQVFPYSSGSSVLQYYYRQNGALVGSISYNGATVLFNGTSDYRLKEDLKDYNGLEIINKLKTYNFIWKDTNVRDYGVMAHELQQVLPNYVTGEKDALNKDGSISPQAVDYSKVVPVLIKSIQELSADLTSAKQEIELLKAK